MSVDMQMIGDVASKTMDMVEATGYPEVMAVAVVVAVVKMDADRAMSSVVVGSSTPIPFLQKDLLHEAIASIEETTRHYGPEEEAPDS